jgi:glycine dehydrogenase
MNLRDFGDGTVGISVDETTTLDDVRAVLGAFGATFKACSATPGPPGFGPARTSAYLTHPVFNAYHSEHEMLRYIFKLQGATSRSPTA